jgi:YD repeat-containing protein
MRRDNSTSSIIYNGDGLKAFETDQDGYTTSYGYDGDNRLVSVKLPIGGETYQYDQVGNKISQTDANGHVTKFAYDMRGQLVEKMLPLLQTETMTYNLDGTLATQTDYNGYTTTYGYDPLTGRLLSKTPDSRLGQSSVSYTYFADGNVDTATRGSVEETYAYDTNRSWLTSVETIGGSISNTVRPE